MSSATNQFTVLTISQFDSHNIIHLSFTIAFAQMIIIILLLFETPFRNPLVLRLDQFKIGKPQLAVKSFGATLFVAMMYNIYSVFELRRRFVDAVDSSNHILLAYHMFVAYLMGFSLFLLVTVNSLHRYIKEVVMVTEIIRATKKQNRAYENCMKKRAEEAETIRKDISRLKTDIINLESECSMKEQAVQLLRAESSTLKDRLEGCLVEYDRLLTYNKDLREQLQGVNGRSSHSDGIISAFFSWDRWGL
ncbi:putative B-cell receptor-associated protein 29/31 [Helianthus annuus]|uniref:Endoplasmic reticulum transmembrane protein n=1 Tax=Helianthus annuus TaxID=4232 RepID=A0A251TMC7_HELAN|nr:uncharacterized protein LOC110886084 [Helianthus annuus]XP_021989537.1 uncharacterized protein LOC110886084 [Helianthus annuus]KAF5787279.1 putative B-cell receptor-associated protein 29/31 [Helianthus annuus]